jgi:hypothetical protein
MTLLSDVPAAAPLAADRAGCKAPTWCDFDDAPDSKDPRIQVYIKAEDGNYGVRRGHRIYCSGTCAPPLAAQPAETKPIEECGYPIGSDKAPCVYSKGHGGRHWPAGPNGERASKPAPQPAPACAHGCGDVQVNTACPTHGKPAPAKPVRCIGIAASSAHECRGPSLVRMVGAIRGVMCERWMMTLETKASDWTPNSGLTPYTGPERLERARLAHSSMWADEAEDVR